MRRITIALWIVIAIELLHLSSTYLARRSPLQLQHPARAVESLRGHWSGVRILAFYAREGQIRAGDRDLICYGVENARSVRMEPPVEELRPALTRCFEAAPLRNTRYELFAEGFDGGRTTEAFEIQVRPALPSILFFAISHKEIVKGDAVTLCYGVMHADAVILQPIGWTLDPVAKNCARFYPKLTCDYTLVARGAEGATDRESFTVRVK